MHQIQVKILHFMFLLLYCKIIYFYYENRNNNNVIMLLLITMLYSFKYQELFFYLILICFPFEQIQRAQLWHHF